ncbi:hypothetical protein BD410DRAFT_93253 [Rickenella mellea]|uniref:Uncharacterized protein n=1 Tax=Rickenella mellea TaxID=50990 RepID=A0A4Y7QCG2_9AGAM|nr:hypothetical protein BD410DRAFT_93253 [Rickenella mellea]
MLYFRTWSIYVFSIPMQIVLTLRTWAIWERDLRVAAILIIAEAIYNVTVIVCDSILSKTYRYEPDALLGPLLDCYSGISGMSSTIVKVAFASLMIADAIVFVLILMRAIKEGRRTRTGILRVLVRDGAVYYAVLFAFSVGNLFLTTFLPLKRITLMGSLAPALLVAKSIGASHIVLNLREYFYGQQQMSELLSGINFGERRTILDEISRQVVFEPAVFDTQDEKPRGNLY